MFRLSRALPLRQQIPLGRPIQLPSRAQSRNVWTRFGSSQKQIQPVRMRAAGFTWKKVFAFCVYTGTTYWALQFLLRHIDIQIEEIEEDASDHTVSRSAGEEGEWEEQGDEEEEEEDEFADEDSTFIPMTWATKLPRSFYKGSDPEWQAFVKFAKDKPRQKKIQDELLQLVFAGLQHHPKIAMQAGKDLKIGRWWLEISFPDGPPQEYVRSGLEIGDDFIAWSPQKISPETYHRTTRALWPKATFEGFFATAMIFGGIQYRKLKQALGWEEANPFSVEERFKLALEMMEKQKSGRGGSSVSGKAQTSPDGSPGSLVSAASAANEAQSSPRASEERTPLPLPLPWQLSLPLPSSTDLINPVEFQIARHVFTQQLMKGWRPKKLEPPRGSFVVQGLMDVRGTKARVMFDVQACYDPKESKFVVVNAGVRSIKRWNQAPKCGP